MTDASRNIAVVTGGASGIGAACCRELARRGARVVVLDRDGGAANVLAKAIDGHGWSCDIEDDNAVEAAASQIEARFGAVDILVNCAGIFQRPLSPETLDIALWDKVIAVNQRGTYVACVAFGRRMAAHGGGSIVNIASIAAEASMPLHAYSPSKAAVVSMTQCLAAEWGRSGVRVNAVSPGYTLTPALQQAIDRGERVAGALENSALGRMAKPEEIASVVAFLAGPAASAVTGVNLPIDCGWLIAQTWTPYGGVRPERGPGVPPETIFRQEISD
ncbi:SDR family oxidoreductase [Mesorhizobium sp. B2-3-4]|uniref:SDR family NAD(P)-dependent oxidoreductase n=1 Tax=Mesorhizobium sp. B2-3-4 TaxID=2589959 RepID=UPI00112D8537|nr:SDR family oxidoreductase [Mesorhizobium sp. B2-3-4]TPM32776.1 SDR family oxidoreductase [Mesorhizobium sp. B2-3-4]